MANYRLQIKPSAARELEAIPLKDRKRLVTKIRRLAKEPRPPGCEKLSGREKFRLRQGHYRVPYSVDDAESVVVIVKVGHRRDVYR
ncbi:MAG: type II toxin-antitoxin system RelE/ParE family toxin [Gemmatimonadetes bacterium]|nr:type II toxin-antitoxin system RelE/ParE family toxin [Gemmatimonadota bacterium]